MGTPILPPAQYLKADDIFMASLPPNIHKYTHKDINSSAKMKKVLKTKFLFIYFFRVFTLKKNCFDERH